MSPLRTSLNENDTSSSNLIELICSNALKNSSDGKRLHTWTPPAKCFEKPKQMTNTIIERVKKEYPFYSEKEKHYFLSGALAAQKLLERYDKPIFPLIQQLERGVFDDNFQLNEVMNQFKELQEHLNTINENTSFIKKIYCTPVPKKQSAKQISKEERIQKLQNKMLSRGKKGGV